MKGYLLTVERVIPAPADKIFDILADPTKHALIDGSGMVQGMNRTAEPRLALGTQFTMSMRAALIPYSTVSRVTEFEEDRRIAWKTGPSGMMGRFLAGRVWRFELEPEGEDTLVRETWDITEDHQRALLKLGDLYSGKTRRDMERTLERLSVAVAG
jgi:uncharacterized protein YndB with AHSA1/START domain